MAGNVYAMSKVVGSSKTSIEDAVQNAIETAAKSINHMEWFEVTETRGHIADGKVDYFQVTLEFGFRYEK